jgi:hypothetical protein
MRAPAGQKAIVRNSRIGRNAMRSATNVTPAMLGLAALMMSGFAGSATAQTTMTMHEIPQSLRIEHEDTLNQLTVLSRRSGPVGVEARKALNLFRQHIKREEEYVLPPLTLLPRLADGKATPDMKWAIAMSDRVKADREEIFQEHTQITDAMNALANAARQTHDSAALDFAHTAVADSLNDTELMEPMSVVVGDYLKMKLTAGQ